MNGAELFEKFTNIDNKFIEEVMINQKKKVNYREWITLAASFCILISIAYVVVNVDISQDSSATEGIPDGQLESATENEGIQRISSGTCIVDGDEYFVVIDDITVEMLNGTDDIAIFEGLSTGDVIEILHGEIVESDSMKTTVYRLEVLESGELNE